MPKPHFTSENGVHDHANLQIFPKPEPEALGQGYHFSALTTVLSGWHGESMGLELGARGHIPPLFLCRN